jgi:hypothetical protein
MCKVVTMEKSTIVEIERTLKKTIGIELSLNDLRIIVGCFNALAYWSDVYDDGQLDPDGWALKDRLEGLYRDELEGEKAFGVCQSKISA